MNRIKRYTGQVVLWLTIGIILWLNQDTAKEILKENLVIFTFQFLLIGASIYYASPTLLFRKKYLLFALFSIVVIVLSVWMISMLFPLYMEKIPAMGRPQFGPPPPPDIRRPPSHFLLHTLILTITYILANGIETFIFFQKKEEETIKAKNINLQNELKLLKSQINPHFLFNALNNIYTLAGFDANKTQKSILNLSDMLRYVLYECDQETVPIIKEVEYIENYLRLFKLKSSKSYPITTEFNIQAANISIAPMLFIPFIENAIKHSNIDDIKNSYIRIKIDGNPDEVVFEVVNSMPQEEIVKDKIGGIGLENVKKRLAILYPQRHELEIDKSNKSFSVKLILDQHE